MVFPILPVAGLKAGLSLWFIGLILSANRAMRIIASPLVGVVADRLGGRRTMLAGLALQIVVMGLFALGIVTGKVGAFFLIGRIVHGPASASVFVAAQALALHAGGATHGGRAAGTVRAAIILGVPIGLLAGGLLSDAVGDAATFEVAALVVAVALAVGSLTVPDLRAKVRRRPPLRESLGAMRDRRLFAVGGLNFALNFAAGGMVLTTLVLLVHERHLSILGRSEKGTAGVLMAVLTILDAATTPIAGRIGDRLRSHAGVATFGLGLLAIGLVVIGVASSVTGFIAGVAVVAVGAAGLGPSLLVLMGEMVPEERRGTGAGLLQLSGDVGGMLGPLVGTMLFARSMAIPYLGTAALVAAFIPLAVWLTREERRARG